MTHVTCHIVTDTIHYDSMVSQWFMILIYKKNSDSYDSFILCLVAKWFMIGPSTLYLAAVAW